MSKRARACSNIWRSASWQQFLPRAFARCRAASARLRISCGVALTQLRATPIETVMCSRAPSEFVTPDAADDITLADATADPRSDIDEHCVTR